MEPESTHNNIPNGRERVGIPPTSYEARNMVVRPSKNAELKSLESRNWLIHDHYCREEYDICKVLIQEELDKSNGMCEYANYLLGLILRHEGKIQESLEYFQTCHTLNPKSVDNIKQVARSLFLLGSHRQSMEAYFEAEKVADKPDWDIYHNIGMCFFHLKDYAKAKPYLVKAIQLGGQECSFENLAKIHYLEGDVDGALEIYIAGTENNAQSLLRGDKYKKGTVILNGEKKWWSKTSIKEGQKLPLPDDIDEEERRESPTAFQDHRHYLLDWKYRKRLQKEGKEGGREYGKDDEITTKDVDAVRWLADLKAKEVFRSLSPLQLPYSSDEDDLSEDDYMETSFIVKSLLKRFNSK